ncbi:restriction endonuclease subunit S [Streptococcus salivarius]
MDKKNNPVIRFHNYKELWECDRLKNIFRTIRNAFVGTATPYYVEKGHFYLESNNVKNGKINYNSQIFINDEFYEKQRDKWLKTNDIVMVQSGHVGHTAVIPKELNNTAAHALIVFTDYKKEVNPHFLNYQFQSSSKRKELDLISTGNTIKHILASEMKSFKMDFPTVEEQSAIGSLFRTLDDLLSSYKDNLANYQSLKETMLSKMFPKAGQTVPEIRLDGFEGEWDEWKLSDISQKVTEKNKDNIYSETFTNSAEFGIINQRDFFDKDISNEKSLNTYYVVRNNDYVYNPRISNFAPVGPIKRNKLGRTGVMSPLYFVFRVTNSNIDLDFLETFFNTNTWHKFMKLNGDSGARADRFAIKDSVFLNMPISIPSFSEQQSIGSYFSNLDQLLTSYREKITQLETLKKKLLQDMFI